MGGNLFSFLYNTLKNQANDQRSSKWLPRELERIGLPLHSDAPRTAVLREDSAGVAQSISSVVLAQWQLLLEADLGARAEQLDDFVFIPLPQRPFPELTLKNLVFSGLQNVTLLEPEAVDAEPWGYLLKAAVQGPAYDTMPGLNLSGEFSMDMAVCAADRDEPSKPTKKPMKLRWMKWPAETVNWHGSFSIDAVSGSRAICEISVRIAGGREERALSITVDETRLRGVEEELPVLRLDPEKLVVETDFSGIGTILAEQTKKAFTYKETQAYLMEALNDAVNAKALREKMSREVTQYIARSIDKQLGPLGAGKLPCGEEQKADNAVNQYLFDRARYALAAEQGSFYLPRLIRDSRNPVLEPYLIGRIGCGDCTFQGISLENIVLTDISVSGLSNLEIQEDSFLFERDGSIFAQADLALRLAGGFSFLCAGSAAEGSLEISLQSRRVQLRAYFTGEDADSLAVCFDDVRLNADPAGLTVTVTMQSIFLEMINLAFNTDAIKSEILKRLEQKISGEKASISASATARLRTLVREKLE